MNICILSHIPLRTYYAHCSTPSQARPFICATDHTMASFHCHDHVPLPFANMISV